MPRRKRNTAGRKFPKEPYTTNATGETKLSPSKLYVVLKGTSQHVYHNYELVKLNNKGYL